MWKYFSVGRPVKPLSEPGEATLVCTPALSYFIVVKEIVLMFTSYIYIDIALERFLYFLRTNSNQVFGPWIHITFAALILG
mgnify:FL=1